MKKVSVLGLGYIGLPTSIILAESGYDVLGFDVNKEKVNKINSGDADIYEPDVQERLKKVLNISFRAYSTLQVSDYYVIAVPTPINQDKTANIDYVISASNSISSVIKKGDTVILESTVPVGTTEKIAQIIKEKTGLCWDKDFYIGFSPERVLPGNIFYELVFNSRVIGGINEDSSKKLKYFYSTFVKSEISVTNVRTAEMTKLVENSSRDVEIAFAHEVSQMAQQANIDPYELISIANKHPRVNILSPTCGVGGHCLAVDPWFLVETFSESTDLIKTARVVNDDRPKKIVAQVKKIASDYKEKNNKKLKLSILGLTYKANVDDLRESPALEIAKELVQNENIEARISDPYVNKKQINENLKKYFCDYFESIEYSDVVLILVGHKQFLNLNSSLLLNKKILNFAGKEVDNFLNNFPILKGNLTNETTLS